MSFQVHLLKLRRHRRELQWKGACGRESKAYGREVRWQPLCYKQSPAFTQKFQKKVSSFLQLHMKTTLFVKTTASPITTKRRVFYPLVNIILYYLETFKSYSRSCIHFASPINTWTVCMYYSSTDSVERLLQRVNKCLITCNEQLTLITESREWTECRALQKRNS